MKVSELKAILNDLPREANDFEIIIGGQSIDGIACQVGSLKKGWMHKNFSDNARGRQQVIVFTRAEECAPDDELVQMPI